MVTLPRLWYTLVSSTQQYVSTVAAVFESLFYFPTLPVMLSTGVIWDRVCFFFFQAEDGIRDADVNGVQTCALPILQRGELEFARHTNERPQASYPGHNFESIRFQAVEGEVDVLPGIRCVPTPGHVPYHQSVVVESGGERACFVADLVPTTAHLPLPWIMGYDLEPLVTLESKRRLYGRAEAEGWLLVFEHDPEVVAGRLGRDGKGFGLLEPRGRG